MNATQHRAFATQALGVSAKIYDEMNAAHETRNAAIRTARAEWEKALGTANEDAAAAKLDAALAA